MMRTVRLYGVLGEKFGREFQLDVSCPAEAIRALCAVVKGFRQHLADYSEPGYHVRVGGVDATADKTLEELGHPCSKQDVISIIPAIAGSNATARIIVGIILIVVGVIFYAYGGQVLISIGAGLLIGGVAELLAPKPMLSGLQEDNAANEASYAFGGPVNTTAQGNPVPVGYGELIVGGHTVDVQMWAMEIVVAPPPVVPTDPPVNDDLGQEESVTGGSAGDGDGGWGEGGSGWGGGGFGDGNAEA